MGLGEGKTEGLELGADTVGRSVGDWVGITDGIGLGAGVGIKEGLELGSAVVGTLLGLGVGITVGLNDG